MNTRHDGAIGDLSGHGAYPPSFAAGCLRAAGGSFCVWGSLIPIPPLVELGIVRGADQADLLSPAF